MRVKMWSIVLFAVAVAFQIFPERRGEEALFPPRVMQYISAVAEECLSLEPESMQIELLTGGYDENAVKVYLKGNEREYVLRVWSEAVSFQGRQARIHAMIQAASVGVAPAVSWVSTDHYAILMDYIPGATLSLDEARREPLIEKIACWMRKVHAMEKNPYREYSFEEQMEGAYSECSPKGGDQEIWEKAISLIREGAYELKEMHAPLVNTHGDLNPRNILISGEEIYFIDWEDGLYTDPFQDVAFFSIMMDYTPEEEAQFLQSYLGQSPTGEEAKRFLIAKMMNFARLALGAQYIALQLGGPYVGALDSPKEWSYYARAFAKEGAALSAEFFWEAAASALAVASDLDEERQR